MNFIPPLTLQDQEAQMVEQAMPANQAKFLGSRMQVLEQRTLHIQKIAGTIAGDFHTNGFPFQAEVSGELVDAWAVCTGANASGTLTLQRVSTAMTSAIVSAVADALARTASIVQAQKAIVQGETLNVKTNGAADRGILYIAILRT